MVRGEDGLDEVAMTATDVGMWRCREVVGVEDGGDVGMGLRRQGSARQLTAHPAAGSPPLLL